MYDLSIKASDPGALTRPRNLFELQTNGEYVVAVKGFTKLIQKWLRVFFTERGTHPGDPNRGTIFPRIIDGNVVGEEQVESAVVQSISQANSFIRRAQNEDRIEDPEARLSEAQLRSFDYFPSQFGIEIVVDIENENGNVASVNVPQVDSTP